MDPINNSETLEKAHKTNIHKLLEEFGETRKEEIHSTYDYVRFSDENNARIHDFLPIFVYRAVRESLINRKRVLAAGD